MESSGLIRIWPEPHGFFSSHPTASTIVVEFCLGTEFAELVLSVLAVDKVLRKESCHIDEREGSALFRVGINATQGVASHIGTFARAHTRGVRVDQVVFRLEARKER